MTHAVALILALVKALPALERLLARVEETRREARAAELHDAIDLAITQARTRAPVCPRGDCPLLRVGVRRSPSE